MNRTALILVSAGALVALAVLVAPREPEAVVQPSRSVPVVNIAPIPVGNAGPAAVKDGALGLHAQLASPWVANGGAPNYLTVEVKADEARGTERVPVNLAVVIDRSGSMAGEKLRAAKEAARQLVGQLRDGDRLAIVHYGSDVRVLESLEASAVTREQMRAFIARIDDEGSTNISGALRAAADALREHVPSFRASRIILLSDGQPTDGITSRVGLEQVVRELHERGVTVTALGVGGDYDEVLMRALAEAGGGFTGYLEDASRLAEVFGRELDQATRMVARDVTLTLVPRPGVRVEEVLGRPMQRVGDEVKVRLSDFSGGLSSRVVVRLSVGLREGDGLVSLGELRLAYRDLQGDGLVSSSVGLAATVTSDAQLALQNADPQLLEHAARAERARQLQEAAVHFRAGNREEGMKVLDVGFGNLRQMFGASANALAGSGEEFRNATDAREAARRMQKRSLSDFGGANDVY